MASDIIVAGHICLDIIPEFLMGGDSMSARMQPGKLLKMGPALFATGSAVSNTGLALHRLGLSTRLIGKVGSDPIGRSILEKIAEIDPVLAGDMIVDPTVATSYTVVLNPPGQDRIFLHCPGANDHFRAGDIDDAKLRGAKLFHFGYPTLMRSIYSDGGREMEAIFRRVKQLGLTTSLDMSMPDPESEAGRVDWAAWLMRVLPHVDVFLPSLDEIRLMLHVSDPVEKLADLLAGWGAGIVGFKLGDQGLTVRWKDKVRKAPCFQVEVVGTTGAGDCTIAGFLAGLVRGLPPDEVMTMAVAVGACCCEAPDATSGIQSWEETQARIAAGWPRLSLGSESIQEGK